MRLSDDKLRGKTVIAADGQAIGEIDGLFFDTDGWRIASLHLKIAREMAERLGTPRSLFHASTVEVPVDMVQSVGDAVVLSVAVADLRQALAAEIEAEHARTH